MYGSESVDIVESDDDSVASGSSSGKKRAVAPAKYVWQYFKRYKDPLGKEVKRTIAIIKCALAANHASRVARLSQLRITS
ncbi:TPA: hypothetical protein ACH3X1_012478 [Trebouxia sp. C0004]